MSAILGKETKRGEIRYTRNDEGRSKAHAVGVQILEIRNYYDIKRSATTNRKPARLE
jgi:hypothetical protein